MSRHRLAAVLLAAASVLIVLAGCSPKGAAVKDGKVNVVTSFFPLYDFAREIGGEHANVVNMIPAGVEPHDWTPKSQDMTNVANAQVFVYQGAGFEGWTDDLLGGIGNSKLVVVEASKGIELLPAEEDHGHGHYDPHTWLSPRSALTMAANIKEGLVKADPEHAADYEKNYESLSGKLKELDRKYEDKLSGSARKEIVVSHQAFGYMARDYGLAQVPIMGLAPDAEPTAQDLKKISEFVKEHKVRYIFTEELLSDELAKTLADDLGVRTLTLHPVEGLTEEEMKSGETYVSLMEENLDHLMTALNQ